MLITNHKQTYSKNKKNKLYTSLLMSIVCVLMSCLCFVYVTYAWFNSNSVSNENVIDSGIVFLKLFKTDESNFESLREDISEANPIFSNLGQLMLNDEIVEYVAVSNYGDFNAQYSINYIIESINNGVDDPEKGDLSEIIDVFFAFVEKDSSGNYGVESWTNIIDETPTSVPKYIYLGKLKDVFQNAIDIKGIVDIEEEDLYCLRLKMPATADEKYQNCQISLSVELNSIQYMDEEIVKIKAISTDESKGLVLGGGTYTKDGSSITIRPLANKGYKFSRWIYIDENNEWINIDGNDVGTDNTITIEATDEYNGYEVYAVFEVDSSYEEDDEDVDFD